MFFKTYLRRDHTNKWPGNYKQGFSRTFLYKGEGRIRKNRWGGGGGGGVREENQVCRVICICRGREGRLPQVVWRMEDCCGLPPSPVCRLYPGPGGRTRGRGSSRPSPSQDGDRGKGGCSSLSLGHGQVVSRD
jgi:hypothetical protein